MYYGDEVCDFKRVPNGKSVKVSQKELELGARLIDRLTTVKGLDGIVLGP
jgi:2-keto-3-deoxy-L-rhamnonate aldolase RhmA